MINKASNISRFERHIVFPKMLALNCPDFEAESAMFNADVEKEGTCRRFISVNTNPEQGAATGSANQQQAQHQSSQGQGQSSSSNRTYTNTYSIEVSVFGYTESGDSANAEIFPYSAEDCEFPLKLDISKGQNLTFQT